MVPKWKWMRAAWLPGALLLALVIAVSLRLTEARRFAEMVQRAEPFWLLLAVVLQLGTYVCTAAILALGLHHSGSPIRFRSLLPVGLVKLFVDQLIPTAGVGGTLIIVRILERRGVRAGIATAVIVVSVLAFYGAYALAVALTLGILWLHEDLSAAVLATVTIFSVLAATVPVSLLWLTRGGHRVLPAWVKRLPGVRQGIEAVETAPPETLHDRRLWLLCTGLQFAIFVLDVATLRAVLLALGHVVEVQTVFAAFVLASVAANLSLLPGGVGAFEAGSVAVLRLLGVPLEASLASTLLLRGLTLWLPMLPGLCFARREMGRAPLTGARR
jgi:hypothetical protein